jgi:hypothetical protein
MFKIKVLSVLLILFCVGCAHTTNIAKQKDFSDEKKAVVLARVFSKQIKEDDISGLNENVWVHYENEKRTGKKCAFSKKMKAYSIEPGIYYLDTFQEIIGNNSYSKGQKNMGVVNWLNRQVGSKPSMLIKHVKFIAEPGDVVYIGDVVLSVDNGAGKAHWEIIDNYDEAAASLKINTLMLRRS